MKENAKNLSIDAFDAGITSFGKLMDTVVNLQVRKKVSDFGDSFMQKAAQAEERRAANEFRNPIDAQRFFQAFEKAISTVTGDEGRLVIFIDDLDRCHDMLVFKLLEQIKLYLSARQCVFVFGLDRTHVENAVSRAGKYNLDEARQYVEKLFQARFQLPRPRKEALEKFIKNQLDLLELDLEQELEFPGLRDSFAEDMVKYVPDNPRMIKNILNGLPLFMAFLFINIDQDAEQTLEPKKALLVYLFRSFYPDAYELLLQDPENTLQGILSCFSGKVDYSNDLHNYLHFITENPTKRTPNGTRSTFIPKTEAVKLPEKTLADTMPETRFHKIRSGAWQAEALHRFQEAFRKTFFNQSEELQKYLI